ncbi:MAG: efflux RND transporter periplasmic adaptor subunit [Planctomycetota bacterium]
MAKKIIITGAVILAACAVYILVFKSDAMENQANKDAGGADKEAAAVPQSFEEAAKQPCEHNIAIAECAKCCYEVGVVRLHPSLMKTAGSENGLIETGNVQKKKPIVCIQVGGEIQPNLNKFIDIRSKVNGVIIRLQADIGQAVKSGDIIGEIDSNEYRELHLEFFRFSGLLKLAEKNYEREDKLYQKKLTIEKDFLEAQSEVEKIKIELDTNRRKLSLLGLSAEELKNLPSHANHDESCYLPIRTPLDGVIVERKATPGELVEANGSLMTVGDLSVLWGWVNLYEKNIGALQEAFKNGQVKAEISMAAYPGKIFYGRLDYIADKMDEHTRTIKARIVLDNSEGFLKIGMFADCRLLIENKEPILMIPQDALLDDGDIAFVFKRLSEGVFVKQVIKIGQIFANGIEVKEGLNGNETIISRGAFVLKSDILREKMGAGCAD